MLAAGCDTSRTRPSPLSDPPDRSRRRRREAERRVPGAATVHRKLRAVVDDVDLGGRVVRTWSYDGTIPAPVLRARVGDVLDVDLGNDLPESTTIHWHGIAAAQRHGRRPPPTQDRVDPGRHFRYRFIVDAPGTYWYHSHMGDQADRGLYAPIVVDDPAARRPSTSSTCWCSTTGSTASARRRIASRRCSSVGPTARRHRFIGEFRSDAARWRGGPDRVPGLPREREAADRSADVRRAAGWPRPPAHRQRRCRDAVPVRGR